MTTEVTLWHPLHGTTEDTLALARLADRPRGAAAFKQAHREIYLLTDAERAHTYLLEPLRRAYSAPAPVQRALRGRVAGRTSCG